MKINTIYLILSSFLILLCSDSSIQKHLVNLQFVTGMDGEKILTSLDSIISEKTIDVTPGLKLFRFGKTKILPATPLNQINTTNPQLAQLWNSTSMVFGAAANGVGIGTTFAIKKLADGKMIFVTNFHVVEQFCDIPQEINSDIVGENDFKYPCQALFVLHDVAIDTQANSASVDGAQPWKSEVISLDFFDKQRDLAAFRISLPDDNNLVATSFESNYDLKNLLIARLSAEKTNPTLPPITVNSIEMSPLTAFSLYLVAFSMPKPGATLIQKQWFKGTTEGARTYENDKKLGFITALKHTIEVLPGSSGGPLALSDGRIVGINTSVEIKQFYAKKGILWWAKEKLETYYSYFAMPSPFINAFIDKLN